MSYYYEEGNARQDYDGHASIGSKVEDHLEKDD